MDWTRRLGVRVHERFDAVVEQEFGAAGWRRVGVVPRGDAGAVVSWPVVPGATLRVRYVPHCEAGPPTIWGLPVVES